MKAFPSKEGAASKFVYELKFIVLNGTWKKSEATTLKKQIRTGKDDKADGRYEAKVINITKNCIQTFLQFFFTKTKE